MEFKFLPNILRRRTHENSPVAHAIAGSAAVTSGMYGSVFATPAGGWDVERAVTDGLERVIWVYRCVDAIASNQASVPMVMREGDPEEGRIVKMDDLLKKILNQKTNVHESAFDFKYRLSSQLLLSKRGAFIELVRDGMGRVKAMELLPPHMVEPIPDPKDFVSGYRMINTYGMEEVILPKNRVLWLRTKVHPLDPYIQLTPLTAAGLAVETDWLSRLFNRNFLLNDGRPGLLIALRGHINPRDAEEIKRKFSGGPEGAGRTTVVEAEDMVAQDLSATPRDMQWLEAIRGSKEDILLAFGTPESVLGNASGRTYDNADAEEEVWWEKTMKPHCDAIDRGLDPLTGSDEDDMFIAHNYDTIEVLQRRKKERHAKAAEDFDQGRITLDEYYELTGRPPLNVAGSRVIYLKTGVIVGKNPADVQEAAQLPIVGVPQFGQLGGAPQPEQIAASAQQGALEGIKSGQRNFENIIAARAKQMAADLSASTPTRVDAYVGRPRVHAGRRAIGTKTHRVIDGDAEESDRAGRLLPRIHPDEEYLGLVKDNFVDHLTRWDEMQADIITGRLDHPKIRKFTRHWEGDGAGTKALNPDYAVDRTRWLDTLKPKVMATMRRVARDVMRQTASDMSIEGVTRVMHARGRGNPTGRSALTQVYGTAADVDQAVSDVLRPFEQVVEDAADRQSRRLQKLISDLDANGESLDTIKREVRRVIGERSSWTQGLSDYLTIAVTEAAKYHAYEQAGDLMVGRWNSMEDERVRPTHHAVDGHERVVGKRFRVGKYWMLRPMDPAGGIEETINCRCFLTYYVNPKRAEVYDRYATG